MELLFLFGFAALLSAFDLSDNDDDGDEETSEDVSVQIGGAGDDDLLGTNSIDRLFGNAGEDTLDGSMGNDSLFGGDGEDVVLGNDGDDFLRGGANIDVILGEAGEDTLLGDGGNDILLAEDFIDGQFLADIIAGDVQGEESDLDPNNATGEADVANGGVGDDGIIFGSNDTVTGGTGQDIFVSGLWVDPDEPGTITDYTPGEDVLAVFVDSDEAPDLAFGETDDGDATLLVDGDVFAVLAGVSSTEADLDDVTLLPSIAF